MSQTSILRSLLQRSRPVVLASVAGSAMGLSLNLAQAQMPLLGGPAQRAAQEPRRLPQANADSVRPLSPPLSLVAGEQPVAQPAQNPANAAAKNHPQSNEVQKQLENLYQQNGRPMPQMVPMNGAVQPQNQLRLNNGQQPVQQPQGNVQQQPVQQPQQHQPQQAVNAGGQMAQQRPGQSAEAATPAGFFDKMKKAFKSNSQAKNAPADPGMSYPTYRDANNARPMNRAGQPVANAANPQQVPPAAPPQVAPAKVPALFAAPTGVNPIQQPPQQAILSPANTALIPPVNAAPAPQLQQQPGQFALPPKLASQGLPEIYMPETAGIGKPLSVPPAVPPAEMNIGMPRLSANSPVAELPQIAPTVPPVAAAPIPSANADPFENLFPEDVPAQKPVARQAAPVPAPQPAANPYTGLTVESNGFAAPKPQINAGAAGAGAGNVIASPAGQGMIQVVPQAGREAGGVQAPVPPLAAQNANANVRELPRLDLAPAAEIPKLAPAANPNGNRLLNANTPAELPPTAGALSRLELIGSRNGTGMKGFCPVRLRDQRELVAADPTISVNYNGVKYEFASEAARVAFLEEPGRYVPAANGTDIVRLAMTGESQPGKLDHAVWYRGKLYLFSDVETMETFVASPSAHALAN